MSLSGALSSAISALAAQSTSLSMISDNISNADTTGYKTTSAMFADMVTASSSSTSYSAGGVKVAGRANITQQGLLAATTNATDVAIQGAGFFVVSDAVSNGTTYYTRNGAFVTDNAGFLENGGYYLQGWRTDASGNITGTTLEPINTQIEPSNAAATTKTTIAANLPADAASGATFNSSTTVYDSLGKPATVDITWTKSATPANTWTAAFSTTSGSVTGSPVTLTFDNTGALTGTAPSPAQLGIAWTDGAAASTIDLNLTALTQVATGASTPQVNVTNITSDGSPYGTLSSISIGKNGMVDATYSNGQTIPIYQIAVATFAAPDQLSAHSDGMYTSTVASGNASLQTSGSNGAGTIYGSELESSTTDTSGQFSNMISAQQAYSAASQVITTVNKMYDTLMSAMR